MGTVAADRLATLLDAARALRADRIASELEALRDRLAEGRFFVACVGQFKRGKSSLLNALVGQDVLPVGVVPVTAIVTVVRYGAELRARVRFASGQWIDIAPAETSAYVSEKENPENAKGVVAVEIFAPCELLRHGMCLVDTPGLGSVFAHNTEATRELIPQIDAALVVIGADPPLSGPELELIEQTAEQIDRLVVALNKADRLTDEERAQGRSFAEDMLRRRLGREVSILEVSAAERRKGAITRDWAKLEGRLRELAAAGDAVVAHAEERGARRLATALERQIEEQRDALVRPREESAKRIERLQRSIADAERTLSELDYLFKSVQDGLTRSFNADRERFLGEALPRAVASLNARIDAETEGKHLADKAMATAQTVAREAVEEWRAAMAPVAEKLYTQAVARFAEIANEFLRRVADPNDPALAALPGSFEPSLGFRTKAHFYFTDMLTLAGPKIGTRLTSFTQKQRLAAVKKDATAYLERLLATNAARVANDFTDQVLESRRRVQAELREHLRAVVASAEGALERAEHRRKLGGEEVERELAHLTGMAQAIRGTISPPGGTSTAVT